MIGSETGAEGEEKQPAEAGGKGRTQMQRQDEAPPPRLTAAGKCSCCHNCYRCIEALVRLVVCGRSETPSTF